MLNRKSENYILFLILFCVFTVLAYLLVFKLEFVYGDSLSRSFHAYSVFFGDHPKFATIGFIWPPLPTLVLFPFVLIPQLNAFGFAGNIVSALCMSLAAVILNKIYSFYKINFPLRMIFLIVYILNPMILFYAINGMSEAMAIMFVFLITYYSLQYIKIKKVILIIKLAITCVFAIMTRWEFIAIIPVICLMIIISSYSKSRALFIKKTEGLLLLYLTPIVYVILLWIFASWMIMNQPFYFLTSIYSNTGQSAQLYQQNSLFNNYQNNLLLSIMSIGERVVYLFPVYVPLAFYMCINIFRGKNKLQASTIFLFSMSLLVFQLALLFKGQSFIWLRYFIYIIPFSFVFIGFIFSTIKKKHIAYIFPITLIIVFLSNIYSVNAMTKESLGSGEEKTLIRALINRDFSNIDQWSYKKNVLIAEDIKNTIENGKILADDFMAFPLIYYLKDSVQFVETIDNDFYTILADPVASQEVQYLLISKPGGLGDFDAINQKYPGIYENGMSFTTLVKDYDNWKLFKIVR